MDKPSGANGGNVNGDKEDDDEEKCLFDSDTSLPETPDAPSTLGNLVLNRFSKIFGIYLLT